MQTTPTGYFSPKYSIIEKGSRKNTDLLLDGQGFCYTVKCSFPNSRTWMCSTNRNGLNPCRGTVSLRDEHFLIKISHNHPPNNYLEDTIRLRNEVKKKALESIFDSAKYIVEDVLKDFHLKNSMLFWRIELGKIQGRKILRIFSSWLIKNSFQTNFMS